MTVCESCGDIEMNGLGPLCRDCEDDENEILFGRGGTFSPMPICDNCERGPCRCDEDEEFF